MLTLTRNVVTVLALLACGLLHAAVTSAPGASIPGPVDANGVQTPLIDAAGNSWTVQKGVVVKNGTTDNTTNNVMLLLYYDGKIYQETASGLWWSTAGSGWTAAPGDPRPAATTGPGPSIQLFQIDFTCPGGAIPAISATVSGAVVTITGAMCPPVATT
jgi:hypothetical protein